MKKICILSGAGMSAESGIKTFRDADGLWEGHDVMQVASPEGYAQNPSLVLDFYNQRRKQLHEVESWKYKHYPSPRRITKNKKHQKPFLHHFL